ncbi:MAG: hypothetical protein J6386_20130 [Candidatus Synoicihabitans palmerolidicus]|nr:hypothetical protein [Candidatus Synoicihabitans palmerolidicus]
MLDGVGTKRLVVRAVGPGLSDYGVADALADPDLSLIRDAVELARNDGWEAANAELFSSLGAFALAPGSSDAALVTTLGAGVFTTPVGNGGDSGVVLLEVYDTEGAVGTTELTNTSTRALVGTGDATLNTGFVIAGTGTIKLLMRTIGPTLSEFDVVGVLADPTMSWISGGEVVATNDDWGKATNAAEIAAAAISTGAFTLAEESKDAAILIELPAGVYSVVTEGVEQTVGTALVELYRVP